MQMKLRVVPKAVKPPAYFTALQTVGEGLWEILLEALSEDRSGAREWGRKRGGHGQTARGDELLPGTRMGNRRQQRLLRQLQLVKRLLAGRAFQLQRFAELGVAAWGAAGRIGHGAQEHFEQAVKSPDALAERGQIRRHLYPLIT